MKTPSHDRNAIWTTKDGQKIKVKDLETTHLINIINMLRRNKEKLEAATDHYPSFQGEMAQYYAERDWSDTCFRLMHTSHTLGIMELERDYRIGISPNLMNADIMFDPGECLQ